jgi:hypothetical protein
MQQECRERGEPRDKPRSKLKSHIMSELAFTVVIAQLMSAVAPIADCTAVLREAIWGRVKKRGCYKVRWLSLKQMMAAGRVGHDQRNSGTMEANMHIQGFSNHTPHRRLGRVAFGMRLV